MRVYVCVSERDRDRQTDRQRNRVSGKEKKEVGGGGIREIISTHQNFSTTQQITAGN